MNTIINPRVAVSDETVKTAPKKKSKTAKLVMSKASGGHRTTDKGAC